MQLPLARQKSLKKGQTYLTKHCKLFICLRYIVKFATTLYLLISSSNLNYSGNYQTNLKVAVEWGVILFYPQTFLNYLLGIRYLG